MVQAGAAQQHNPMGEQQREVTVLPFRMWKALHEENRRTLQAMYQQYLNDGELRADWFTGVVAKWMPGINHNPNRLIAAIETFIRQIVLHVGRLRRANAEEWQRVSQFMTQLRDATSDNVPADRRAMLPPHLANDLEFRVSDMEALEEIFYVSGNIPNVRWGF